MIRVFPDLESLSQAAATEFVERAARAITARGRFTVSLDGGNTPRRTYELLAGQYADKVDWGKVHVFWGDERNVPPDDPSSNEGMARQALLDHVSVPASQIFPMYLNGDAADAADAYEAILKRYFGSAGLTFDWAMQGMGPDGHTASLFPGAVDLKTEAWVTPVQSSMGVRERISLTPAVLCRSAAIQFMVCGKDKAQKVHEILEENADYPAGYVSRNAREANWLLDEAAAEMLSESAKH